MVMENTSTLLILNPNEENKEYRCDICYKYLSIAPILFSDIIGNICGRCYNDEDLDLRKTETIFHVQKAYENIANYIIFPCIYHNNGCNKQLAWSEVQDHEEICDYKNVICPLSCPKFNAHYEYDLKDTCEWKGINKDLIHHIRNIHPECISNSNEMSILPSDEDLKNDDFNRILVFEFNGILAIAVLYYFKDGECYCNVLIDRSCKDCEYFHYDLEVLDKTKRRCLILPGNKVDSLLGSDLTIKKKIGLELDIEMIKQLLKKSGIMKLSFKVMKVFKDKTEYFIEEASHEPDVETIISDIHCPCGDYLFTPVVVCKNGHNCCEVCLLTVGLCKICKAGFIKKANIALDNITSLTKYACKNKQKGCTYALLEFDDLFQHEINCSFTTKRCVLKCKWEGTNDEMVKHMREKHCILELRKENIFDQEFKSKSYPILFDKKLFILTLEYTFQCSLFISMQCLGLENWDYEFEFRILSSSCSINLLSTHICQPLSFEFQDSRVRPRQIEYPFSFLCQFLTEFDKLKFKVNISKIQNS